MHKPSKRIGLSFLSQARAFELGRWWLKNRLVVLTYHRVLPDEPLGGTPRVPDSLFRFEFEAQVAHLVNHYHVVTGDEVQSFLLGHSQLPPYSVFITFDDGFENNYTDAFPILRRYSITAAFFLTTGLIGSSEALWFDRLDFVLSSNAWAKIMHWLDGISDSPQIRSPLELRRWIKTLPQNKRDQIITSLEAQVDITGPDPAKAHAYKLLKWDQVREMARHGMTIGSHTVSHQILSSATAGDVARELDNSRQQIEQEIGYPCWCFAYPNGTTTDFRTHDKVAVRSSGYACAFTQVPGAVTNYSDRYELPRISMSSSEDKQMFLCLLTGVHHTLRSLVRRK